ncbi:MAG TPA: TRAP transporter substrate-binding protein [Burkholderiaceae bacterium]
MTPIALTILIFAIMLVLMAIRTPIAVSMFVAGTVGYVLQAGWSPLANFLNAQAYARFASYDLSVIPLQGAAATVLGMPGLSGLAQQSVTLKFHTFMAPQSNVWLTMHKPWMEKVEKDAAGHIKFEAYPAMQLGGTPVQLYDQARDGVVDIVWTLPGNTGGRFPRIEVFELPFVMNNAEATSKAYWEYVQTQAPDEFKETQVIALHVHGPGMFHSANKQIKTHDDLKGLKVRGPTRQITKMLSAVGATPVGMPLPQIPDALSKGTIDACVIPWEVVPSVKVHELTKFHSEFDSNGPALYTTTFVMTMNRPSTTAWRPI